MSTEKSVFHVLKLALKEKIGPSTGRKLISYLGGAEQVLKASKKEVCAIDGVGEVHYQLLHARDTTAQATEVIEDCAKRGVTILSYLEEDYPAKLKNCMDAPLILYYDGDPSALRNTRVLSVVGTRNSTRYGEEFAEQLIQRLVPLGVMICSGLAFGIDVTAHKSTLKYGGQTVGVVAHGLDMISPAGHRPIAEKMKANGGLLSEHRPGVKVEVGHYPMRNRIVAGMADALVVLESDRRGGALITAQMANDYNRDVFALPGRVGDQYSRGCNALIQRNQAHILNDIDEFLKMLSWEEEVSQAPRQIPMFVELKGVERSIFQALSREPKTVDVICMEVSLPTSQVSASLLSLEFQGLVKALPGKQYVALASL